MPRSPAWRERSGEHGPDVSDRAPALPPKLPAAARTTQCGRAPRARCCARSGRCSEAARDARAAAPRRAGSASIRAGVRTRMVERLRAGGIARRARARRAGRGAAPSLRRQRAGQPGLRRHQPADRPRPDDLQAVGGGAHDRAAVRRRAMRARNGTLGRVLEIGTGCGYQAARAGATGAQVISIERLQAAARQGARRTWRRCARAQPAILVYGDGRLGHPPNAPYDSIIAAAGGDDVPAGVARATRRRRAARRADARCAPARRRCWSWSIAARHGMCTSCS